MIGGGNDDDDDEDDNVEGERRDERSKLSWRSQKMKECWGGC